MINNGIFLSKKNGDVAKAFAVYLNRNLTIFKVDNVSF